MAIGAATELARSRRLFSAGRAVFSAEKLRYELKQSQELAGGKITSMAQRLHSCYEVGYKRC